MSISLLVCYQMTGSTVSTFNLLWLKKQYGYLSKHKKALRMFYLILKCVEEQHKHFNSAKKIMITLLFLYLYRLIGTAHL